MRGAGLGFLLIAAIAAAASGQDTRSIVIRVRVVDSASRVVPGADVSILQGLQTVVAQGATDERGVRQLSVPRTGDDYQIAVRKIGYHRGDRFITKPGDTSTVTIVLAVAAQELAPVTVTAEQDWKRERYHVDADEIMNSKRLILDGMDVLLKIKPDILDNPAEGCALTDVWINGKRQVFPPPNDMAAARRGRPLPKSIMIKASPTVMAIMSRIKPEHIEEMTYEDCTSTAVPLAHARHALFVVLKPGVGFDDLTGSYVVAKP